MVEDGLLRESESILYNKFCILILLAYVKQKNSVQHKRYLYIGTLDMLGPILDRVAGKIMNVDELLPL